MSPATLTVNTNGYAGTLHKDYSTLNEYELHANDELLICNMSPKNNLPKYRIVA
jgi:hypothetical protein